MPTGQFSESGHMRGAKLFTRATGRLSAASSPSVCVALPTCLPLKVVLCGMSRGASQGDHTNDVAGECGNHDANGYCEKKGKRCLTLKLYSGHRAGLTSLDLTVSVVMHARDDWFDPTA